MEETTGSSRPGRGGNPSRNRKAKQKRNRKRDNSRRGGNAGNKGGGGPKRNKGPPSPPQTKIVIRNIGDVNRFGTVKEVIAMTRSIIENVNEKLLAATSRIIQLDEASVEYLIQEEEAVKKAIEDEEEARKKEEQEKDVEEKHDNEDNNEKKDENGEEESSKPNGEEPATKESKPGGGVNAAAPGPNSNSEPSSINLGARIVYIVPPKQTRRRGVKPGCAYLVIAGPTIEAKEPTIAATASDTKPSSDPPKEEKKEPSENNGSEQKEGTKPADESNGGEKPTQTEENHVVIVEPEATSSGAPPPNVPTVDYSREVTKGRFLVLQAIGLMQAHVKEDSKSEQNYAGSMVEVAMSGKTYKHQFHRRDRREGTLEQTADYKRFIENAAKAKEELMARPKPAPGGGLTPVIPTGTGTDTAEKGQVVAALVEHIRNKRAEASKRKKAKKKAKELSNKEKGGGAGGGKPSRKKKGKEGATKEEGGKKGGRKKDGKKGKRAGKKKNAKPAAPTVVLKPGAGAPGPAPAAQPTGASLPGINGGMGGFQNYG